MSRRVGSTLYIVELQVGLDHLEHVAMVLGRM